MAFSELGDTAFLSSSPAQHLSNREPQGGAPSQATHVQGCPSEEGPGLGRGGSVGDAGGLQIPRASSVAAMFKPSVRSGAVRL